MLVLLAPDSRRRMSLQGQISVHAVITIITCAAGEEGEIVITEMCRIILT
jgi:hypothetical protein